MECIDIITILVRKQGMTTSRNYNNIISCKHKKKLGLFSMPRGSFWMLLIYGHACLNAFLHHVQFDNSCL